MLITLNKFDEALNYIDKLLKIEKGNFKAIKDKAFVFYNLKKFKLARKYIDLAIEIDSEDYFAQNIKGLIRLKENNFKIVKSKNLGEGPFVASYSLFFDYLKKIPLISYPIIILCYLLDKILSLFHKTNINKIYPICILIIAKHK